MKCPKCGFVSFPGLEQCKKCGHRFTVVGFQAGGLPPMFHQPPAEAKPPALPDNELARDHPETGGQVARDLDRAMEPEGAFPGAIAPEQNLPAPQPSQAQDLSAWQAELAERVQEYRQKRARLHKDEEDARENLDLNFGSSVSGPQESVPKVIEFPPAEESQHLPDLAPDAPLAPLDFGLENFESPADPQDIEASSPPAIKPKSSAETAPLEIEFGSFLKDSSPVAGVQDPYSISDASMRTRFLAGTIDFLVLLAGAAVYALIFWRAGGRFSTQPVELAAAVVIGVFFILLYFTGCTALASATPGLIWAGLEVTTFEGNRPRLADCLWRGFGYLVSMSALMMGFVWAAVDADGLTWHDRMSRTFLTPVEHQ